MRKLHNLLVHVFLAIVFFTSTATAADCYNAPTSEGLVTLTEGQFACAELKKDQRLEDLGQNYVQCVHGYSFVLPCPSGLRWDSSVNSCNFPEMSNCLYEDKSIDYSSPSTERTTTNSQRTTRQTTKTRTTRTSTTTKDAFPEENATTARARTTRLSGRTRPTRGSTTTRQDARVTPTAYTRPATRTRRRTTRTDRVVTTSKSPSRRTSTTTTTPLTSKPIYDTTTRQPSGKFVESVDCVDVKTSQGSRTLGHGQKACAAIGINEDESDLGKKFVTCSSRTVYIQECQHGLRYDTKTGFCNWPESSTCELEDEYPDDQSFSTKPTTKASTSSRKPGQSTQTPRPSSPGRCSRNNCQLPNCSCFGASPSSIPLKDMPMFIMYTFDDAITSSLYKDFFRALAVDNHYNLFNPNGCPTKSTFYVSHENTDYSLVTALWKAGNEIGSHTIHHELPQGNKDSDYQGMVAEIQGLKDEMLKATGNKALVGSITGFRSPYLRVAGDVQFKVLHDYKFLYDTSILNINILQKKKPHWPYTLNYLVGECINPPCPKKSYPGLWEVPLNGWIGDNGEGCSMTDACTVGKSSWTATEKEWYRFYERNFQDGFYHIKVPMPIFTHGSMFVKFPNSYPAMASWFQDTLLAHDDVWLVTPAQVIQWMKKPLTNKEMISSKWGC